MSFTLKKHPRFPGRPGPLLVAVLDGVGIGNKDESDAVFLARTPYLDRLWADAARVPFDEPRVAAAER